MSDKITDKELKLADRVNELSDAAARPVVTGGGLFAQAVNFLVRRVSRGIMTTALIVFIAYHGFEAFNGALQGMADLQGKRAEVGATIAEEKALNTKVDGETVAVRTMKAEIDRLEQQAAATQAQADAENAKIGNGTVSLQKLRAEIAKTKAEAQEAKAQADAQMMIVNDMPINVAQKKADVALLLGEVQKEVQSFRIMMEGSR
jgi:hypothetical protein